MIDGYAATFDKRSKILYEDRKFFYEVLKPGSFRSALEAEDSDVVFVRNHNPDQVLARTTNGTLQLKEDERGLYFRAEINKRYHTL